MTTYSAVVTTGIYCRPGCGARPRAENVRTFDLPAAAEAAGFRACHRCRPDRVAGPVAGDAPALVCQVVQLLIGRAVARGGLARGLPVAAGYHWDAVRAFRAARGMPGVEGVDGARYRRTIAVGAAPGLLEIGRGGGAGPAQRADAPVPRPRSGHIR